MTNALISLVFCIILQLHFESTSTDSDLDIFNTQSTLSPEDKQLLLENHPFLSQITLSESMKSLLEKNPNDDRSKRQFWFYQNPAASQVHCEPMQSLQSPIQAVPVPVLAQQPQPPQPFFIVGAPAANFYPAQQQQHPASSIDPDNSLKDFNMLNMATTTNKLDFNNMVYWAANKALGLQQKSQHASKSPNDTIQNAKIGTAEQMFSKANNENRGSTETAKEISKLSTSEPSGSTLNKKSLEGSSPTPIGGSSNKQSFEISSPTSISSNLTKQSFESSSHIPGNSARNAIGDIQNVHSIEALAIQETTIDGSLRTNFGNTPPSYLHEFQYQLTPENSQQTDLTNLTQRSGEVISNEVRQNANCLSQAVSSCPIHEVESTSELSFLAHVDKPIEKVSHLTTIDPEINNKLLVLLEDVHLLGSSLKSKENKEGMPCSLNGYWISEAAGIEFHIFNETTENNEVSLFSISTPGFFRNLDWIVTAFMPFAHTGFLTLTAIHPVDLHMATFSGECRICDGKETVTGHWLWVQNEQNCLEMSRGQEYFGDVWIRSRTCKSS